MTRRTILKNYIVEAAKPALLSLVIFSLFINLGMLVPSIYMLQIYDRVITHGNLTTLTLLTVLLIVFIAATSGLELFRNKLLRQISTKLDAKLSDFLFELGHKQALYTSGRLSGAVPLQDLKGIKHFISSPGLQSIFDLPWIPVYLVLMYLFHPWLGHFGLASLAALATLTIYNEKKTRNKLKEAEARLNDAGNSLWQYFRNGEAIRAMGMIDALRRRWSKKYEVADNMQSAALDNSIEMTALSKMLRTTLQSLVLGLGAYLVIRRDISPGMMFACSLLLGRALSPMDQLLGNWKQFILFNEQFNRLSAALEEREGGGANLSMPIPVGAVQIENVIVTAPGRPSVSLLENISINCKAGSIVGIMGPSGAGKSTLARVLLGVWPCARGQVRLDGANIFEWNKSEIGKYVGYLPQNVELFEGTVAQNIARFGDVNDQAVIVAAINAGVHEMILRLEDGYNSWIGPDGVNISGGQRQLIALARALYGDPKLVVLDEPNSNLDRLGELALEKSVRFLRDKGSTVFMITHNMALLESMDHLMVISEGRLAVAGSRPQVLSHLSKSNFQVDLPH